MALAIRGVEKNFYLKAVHDGQIPLFFLFDRQIYTLTVIEAPGERIYLRPDRLIQGFKPRFRMDLFFSFYGRLMEFTLTVIAITKKYISARTPEYILTELGRSYARVSLPPAGEVSVVLPGEERYDLPYPRIGPWKVGEAAETSLGLKGRDLRGKLHGLYQWAERIADGFEVILFQDEKPGRLEERLVAETGRILYLPDSGEGLPPQGLEGGSRSPQPKVITEGIFADYFSRPGGGGGNIRDLIRSKAAGGVCSDVWVPVVFQDYAVGCIRLWTVPGGVGRLGEDMLNTLCRFAALVSRYLKERGYFESGRSRDELLEGKVVNISASGALFEYPAELAAGALEVGAALVVHLEIPGRTIRAGARIVRQFTAGAAAYAGCRFTFEKEDQERLYEYLYGGKVFAGEAEHFLAGQV